MLQAEGFAEIAEWCQQNNLTVLSFTGYLYTELKALNNRHIDKLLKNLDILVDGPFIQEQFDTDRDWVGSKNQKLYFLSDRYKTGIEYEHKEHSMDVLVSEKDLRINGWPFILN